MKRKPPTALLPFSRVFLRPLPDISLATWDRFTTSLHTRHVANEDLSIPERSPRNKRTDVKYVETCNLQNVWDSSDSLNGNSCLL